MKDQPKTLETEMVGENILAFPRQMGRVSVREEGEVTTVKWKCGARLTLVGDVAFSAHFPKNSGYFCEITSRDGAFVAYASSDKMINFCEEPVVAEEPFGLELFWAGPLQEALYKGLLKRIPANRIIATVAATRDQIVLVARRAVLAKIMQILGTESYLSEGKRIGNRSTLIIKLPSSDCAPVPFLEQIMSLDKNLAVTFVN